MGFSYGPLPPMATHNAATHGHVKMRAAGASGKRVRQPPPSIAPSRPLLNRNRCPHKGIDIWPDDWAVSLCRFAGARSDNLSKIRLNRTGRFRVPALVHLPVKGHPMKTGTVKFYNTQKGFGFIQPDDGGKDVFVHATALEAAGMRGLIEGQKISFDVEADRRSGKEAAANLQHA